METNDLKEQIEKLPDEGIVHGIAWERTKRGLDEKQRIEWENADLKALAASHTALEQRVAQYEKLLSVAIHPFCPCVRDKETDGCRTNCVHRAQHMSFSCKWCRDKWETEKDALKGGGDDGNGNL